MSRLVEAPLRRLAHARAGDKGNRLNISLVCFSPAFFEPIRRQITPERVSDLFRARHPSRIARYELPKLSAFNFVLDDVLEGGVNASLGLDGHGKALSFLLLSAVVSVEAELLREAPGPAGACADVTVQGRKHG